MRKTHEIKREMSDLLRIVKNQETTEEARAAAYIKLESLTNELQRNALLEASERALAANSFSKEEKEAVARFSFLKFMREAVNGSLTGLEEEMAQEAQKEAARNSQAIAGFGIPYMVLVGRDAPVPAGQNATTNADGKYLVERAPINYVDALRKKLIVAQMGATYLSGLVGNVPFVKVGAISAGWGSEYETLSTVAKAAIGEVVMTPKRVGITTAFSRQLLNQTGGDIERILMEEMIQAHAAAIEAVAIQGGGTAEPTGILGTSGIGAVNINALGGGDITWAKIVELETKVATANADFGKLGYLTNSQVMGMMKTNERATNTARFLVENGETNGYKVGVSNHVPSNITKSYTDSGAKTATNNAAMIFGNFGDLYIGQWGGLDIVVDPYSLKKSAQVETTINAFHDVMVKNAGSFAAVQDINTPTTVKA